MIEQTVGFTMIRELDASAEELWSYWTDPAEASTWWHPKGVSTLEETVKIDPRVGGRYEYVMVDDQTGERYPTGGVFLEVVPHERLAFTWGRPDDPPEDSPVITVTFEPLGGRRTRMTFDLRGIPGSPGDSVHDGWAEALDNLVEHSQRGG